MARVPRGAGAGAGGAGDRLLSAEVRRRRCAAREAMGEDAEDSLPPLPHAQPSPGHSRRAPATPRLERALRRAGTPVSIEVLPCALRQVRSGNT